MKVQKPVDPNVGRIIVNVNAVSDRMGVQHMLVGAMARDILFDNVFLLPATRATRDVDFAIAVKDWAEFQAMRQALIDTGISCAEGHCCPVRPARMRRASSANHRI